MFARDPAGARRLAEALAGRPLPAGDGARLRVGVVEELIADVDPLTRATIRYLQIMPARRLGRADRVRALVRRSFADAFGRVDVLAWPASPAPPCRIDNPTVELPSGLKLADQPNIFHAAPGNLTGVPGISVPVGLTGGLPAGLQLLAPWGEEARLLDAAEHLLDGAGHPKR